MLQLHVVRLRKFGKRDESRVFLQRGRKLDSLAEKRLPPGHIVAKNDVSVRPVNLQDIALLHTKRRQPDRLFSTALLELLCSLHAHFRDNLDVLSALGTRQLREHDCGDGAG